MKPFTLGKVEVAREQHRRCRFKIRRKRCLANLRC